MDQQHVRSRQRQPRRQRMGLLEPVLLGGPSVELQQLDPRILRSRRLSLHRMHLSALHTGSLRGRLCGGQGRSRAQSRYRYYRPDEECPDRGFQAPRRNRMEDPGGQIRSAGESFGDPRTHRRRQRIRRMGRHHLGHHHRHGVHRGIRGHNLRDEVRDLPDRGRAVHSQGIRQPRFSSHLRR